MSLLRQRAMAVSFESTFRALNPADARAWFVRLTSLDSEAELKLLTSQANVVLGAANSPTAVRAKATAVTMANRRGSDSKVRSSSGARRAGSAWAVIGGQVSCGRQVGSPVSFDRRPLGWCDPRRDGPGGNGHGY